MPDIVYTDEFKAQYRRLPQAIRKKAERQEHIFRTNPLYPSLHTEKLRPKQRELWSFRIDRDYRVIFRFTSDNRVIFLNVGPHHWIYRYTER